jgi:hypothetical protein
MTQCGCKVWRTWARPFRALAFRRVSILHNVALRAAMEAAYDEVHGIDSLAVSCRSQFNTFAEQEDCTIRGIIHATSQKRHCAVARSTFTGECDCGSRSTHLADKNVYRPLVRKQKDGKER